MKRLIPLLACAFLVAPRAFAASCPDGLFVQAESLPAISHLEAIAIAPIDADAFPDMVVVSADSKVGVLIGHGDGTFDPPIVTDVSRDVYSVGVADLDGDTKADLVLGTYGSVIVLIGHGDGTFEPPVEYFTNQYPAYVTVGTFDSNTSPDVATVGGSGSGIQVLLNNGDGTLAAPVSYSMPTSGSLTSGDWNGDGHLDLAATSGASVAVLLGNGDGSFGPPSFYLAGASLGAVTSADLDGDGDLDLIATTPIYVSVLLGNGNGTFQAALQYPSALNSVNVLAVDLDLDGIPDVVVSGNRDFYDQSGGVSVLRGVGGGALGPAESYQAGTGAFALAIGDLNGDGIPDVATTNPTDPEIALLIGTPNGNLYAAPESPAPPGSGSQIWVQADFNGDQRQDFAWANGSSIFTIRGTATGRFVLGTSLAEPNGQTFYGIGAGVFSPSGHTDLVVTAYSTVWLYSGNGDGSFGAPQDLFDSFELGAILVADFTGDGKPDIAFSQGCCGPTNLDVIGANGDGTFQPLVQTALNTDARLLLAAELNGDGLLDAVASTSAGAVLIPGNGDGTFAQPEMLVAGQGNSFWAASGDFDSNGHADLLVSDGSGSVHLFLADSSGVLQPPEILGVGDRSGTLAVGDFDGDGNLDFAVQTESVLVLLGLGNGHFQSPLFLATDQTPSFIATADYDGNGKPDLASLGTSAITTFLNAQLGAAVEGAVAFVVGSPVVLQASAGGGFGTLAYQWRKNGTPLADGGPISGAKTATLTIDPVAFTDAGAYDVVITDSCTSAISSAATVSVEFDDVPVTNPFHADIITIATAGIATGCNTGTSYCPGNPVSRAEMAVFLLKAKYGADHIPPPPPPVPIFPDVPADAFAAAWIDELATLGITAGCGDGNYCPDAPVTRGQMAVFLLKTLLGADYAPPDPIGIFSDVPADYFAIAWIEDLYNRGITAGCGMNPLQFCPDTFVPREQMATFLVRTFGL